MPRPLWKGAISFGLVSIPVELHTAVRDHRPHFRMLHATDKSPVRFERVCIREGEPVAWQDLVKGYEVEKGHFVVLTKDDFKAAAVEKTQTVDIIDFVKAEEIDDRFFEVPYYLTPAKGGDHAYVLLREALKESGRVGIARFVLRDKQHLAAVEVIDKAIVLSGAMIPYEIANSDALFNLGFACGVAQTLPAGVYVAMNGQIFNWDDVQKNRAAGVFEGAGRSLARNRSIGTFNG